MSTCTKCGNEFDYKYKGRIHQTICNKCTKLNIPPPIPIGISHRCICCRLEYMRKPDESLECPRCDALHKHNLSRVTI